jgi:hypothetical protein
MHKLSRGVAIVIQRRAHIRRISDIVSSNRIDLPDKPGIYAFWWMGPLQKLLSSNRRIVLKGPNASRVSIELQHWWPTTIPFPCLYVGKTTSIKKRFSLHLKRGSPGRLHTIPKSNEKRRPVTTSCQLRYGVEHIFSASPNPMEIIEEDVGFSFQTEGIAANVTDRFYAEDLLIGKWKPWFNIDSER